MFKARKVDLKMHPLTARLVSYKHILDEIEKKLDPIVSPQIQHILEIVQKEGIHCNLTLLFSLVQAVECAAARVQLISPFVGRIYDWHKKQQGSQWDESANSGIHDPGVLSVSKIYSYYKNFGISTEIMGASFRNTGQILALAGCDLLTISPELLANLSEAQGEVQSRLNSGYAQANAIERLPSGEQAFRFMLNEDAMASEKLSEGIRAFVTDARKLDVLIEAQR